MTNQSLLSIFKQNIYFSPINIHSVNAFYSGTSFCQMNKNKGMISNRLMFNTYIICGLTCFSLSFLLVTCLNEHYDKRSRMCAPSKQWNMTQKHINAA